MKLIYTAIFISSLLMVSCNTKRENEQLKERIDKLKEENAALKDGKNKMVSTIADYKSFLNEIDDNLKEIDLSTSMVGALGKEERSNPDAKKRIIGRIKTIKELLDNSRMKILLLDNNLISLRKKSEKQSEEILKLDADLKSATQQLMDKESAFIEMAASQEELEEIYSEQVAITNELKTILDRAYFLVGEKKELKEKNIVEADGGFIGIGRVKILNANSLESEFTRMFKSSIDSVQIIAKSIKMVTSHPDNSYEIISKGDTHKIYIRDKKGFWSLGNYLVIEKN